MKIKYLITGTGRCGTVYMSRLLTSIGYMCGHESIFEHDGLEAALNRLYGRKEPLISNCSTFDILNNKKIENWFDPNTMIAESSFLAAPFLNLLKDVKIIHIVRNPLKVINSFVNDIHFFSNNHDMKKWTKTVYEYCPFIAEEKTEIERACRYYVEWNNIISKKCNFLLKIEDQPSKKLFEIFPNNNKNFYFKNKKINSWNKNKNQKINISDIPEGDTKKLFLETFEKYDYIKDIKEF